MALKRPPIVAIMGHVDHGKTTLLDYIRKTNIAAREAGGITQSIGAYEIEHNNQKITFIDTPGHEAFSCMREYGAKVADIAILVVAADDGVKPQTKDALRCILESKTQFIVAVNKIDAQGANIEKTKNELLQNEVYLEGMGGSVSWQAISAKTGEGVNDLLDLIILASEMENLSYDPSLEATGIILSSRLDSRKGNIVGLVVTNGTLKKGKYIGTKNASGKIKILEDFQGKTIDELVPASPALVIGFESLPNVGEIFETKNTPIETAAKDKNKLEEENADNMANIVLKADESGSLEVLTHVIKKIGVKYPLRIIFSGIGAVTENDIKTAANAKGIVISFKSRLDKAADNLAKTQKIQVIDSNIIYELEKDAVDYLKKIKAKDVRVLEVLAVFGARKGKEQVIGGKVTKGFVKNQESFEVWKEEKQIGSGRILNLQQGRKDVAEVSENNECGMLVESSEPIASGHKLIFS